MSILHIQRLVGNFLNFIVFFLITETLICSVSSAKPFSKLFSRLLTSTTCPLEIDADHLIGHHKSNILDINPFNIKTTDTMYIDCYYNQTCSLNQILNFGGFDYHSQTVNFQAEKLPELWKCLGTANVLLLESFSTVADDINNITSILTGTVNNVLDFRRKLVNEINQFLVDFNNSISIVFQQVVSQIVVQLNESCSDVTNEFEQILEKAFSMLRGNFLHQVANQYVIYSNKLKNVIEIVAKDIQTNEEALKTANVNLVLSNIMLLEREYIDMALAMREEFSKYQMSEGSYASIIIYQLDSQISQGFNFNDDSVTFAVRKSLSEIIQKNMNLVNDTISIFYTQIEKFVSNFNDEVTNGILGMNATLQELRSFINANTTYTNITVNSLLAANSQDIPTLLLWNTTNIDPVNSLNSTARVLFANALTQFQILFAHLFVSNVEQAQEIANTAFDENYTLFIGKVQDFLTKLNASAQNAFDSFFKGIERIAENVNNTWKHVLDEEYILSKNEQKRLQEYNLFEPKVTVTTVLSEFLQIKKLINRKVVEIRSKIDLSLSLFLNTTGLNYTIVTSDIVYNLTILIKMTSLETIVSNLHLYENLAKAEKLLGIEKSGVNNLDLLSFLDDLQQFSLEQINRQVEIWRAIIRNEFSNLTTFNSTETLALKNRFSGCSIDGPLNFTGLPTSFFQQKINTLTNFSVFDIINYETFEFNFTMNILGVYGAVKNETSAGIFFELDPSISIDIKIVERLREFSFLRYNSTSELSASLVIYNVLVLGLLSGNVEEFVDANALYNELSEASLHILTKQYFLKVNNSETCDHTTKICQNSTTYGWDNAITNEKNVTLPREQKELIIVQIVNVTELLN